MKIKRIINGQSVEIELTEQELELAFREQEKFYLLSEIGEALDWLNEDDNDEQIDEEEVLKDKTLCDCIIEKYKENLYSNDMDRWIDAIRDSITDEHYIRN